MRSAIGALLLIIVFAVSPLGAQTPPELEPERSSILKIGGKLAWGIGITGQAVGWELTRAHHHVAVAAHLGNGGGHAYMDAYLMRAIGPDASTKDEVAYASFDLTYPHDGWITLFDDLDLEAGEYWLVLAKPQEKAHSSINWIVAAPMSLESNCDVRYLGTKAYTFLTDTAEYLPASRFEPKYEPYGFQMAVTDYVLPDSDHCSQWVSPQALK
jgi:hypothetical protein